MSVPHRFSSGDRHQQILEVATEMFAEKGFAATTTREIAARAQVNEALIFRHFPTKDDLYWAVLETTVRSESSQLRLEELLAVPGDIRTVLAAVAEWMLRRRAQDRTTTRLSLFCALERHDLSQRFFGQFVTSYFEVLADYFRQQMRQGMLRNVDPLMAARSFVGAVAYHSLLRELFGAVDTAGNMDPGDAGKLMVSIWLDGMSAGDGQGQTPRPTAEAVAGDGTGEARPGEAAEVEAQNTTVLQED